MLFRSRCRRDGTGDFHEMLYDTLEAANRAAEIAWKGLSEAEQNVMDIGVYSIDIVYSEDGQLVPDYDTLDYASGYFFSGGYWV